MNRAQWTRIGLAAAVLLVPGGFILGATLAARRAREAIADRAEADATAPGAATKDTPAA